VLCVLCLRCGHRPTRQRADAGPWQVQLAASESGEFGSAGVELLERDGQRQVEEVARLGDGGLKTREEVDRPSRRSCVPSALSGGAWGGSPGLARQ